MRSLRTIAICALLLCWASPARAGSFLLGTSAGNNLFLESFSYDSRPGSQQETGIDGNFGISLSNTNSEFAGVGPVTDHTYALTAGLGWKITRSWEVGALLNLSATPAENLQSSGLSFYGEYTYFFGPEPGPAHKSRPEPKRGADGNFPEDFLADLDGDESDDARMTHRFRPSISFRLTVGGTHLTDKPNAVLQRLFPRLANFVDELNQRSLGLELGAAPLKWFSFRIGATGYSYDKAVNTFLALLSDRRSLGAGTFAASLNGLPQSSLNLNFSFFPSDDWEIDVIGNGSRSISDGATSRGSQVSATHDFNSWLRVGLGLERDVSDSVAQSLLLLNLYFGI